MGAITQPIGSIVGAGIDAASSAATNATNVAIAKRNNETSKQIAQQNNATQIQMNDTNNQFSHDEAELAYQRDLEKMNLENNYNSPVEQLKRFQEAGINPTLGLLGNAAMPAANSSGSPMASPHGSGITPSMPQLQNPAINPFSIGQAVKAFVDAKKAGIESRTLESAMDSILKTYEHNARYAENQADMAEMDNWLKSVYGKQRYNAETNEILERTYKFTQEALLAQKQGDLVTAQKQRELAHEEVLKLDKQYRQKEVDNFDKLLQTKLDNIEADTVKSKAEARYTDYQTDYVLPKQVENLASQAKVNKNLAGVYAVNLVSEWEHYNNTKLTDDQRKILQQKISEELKSAVNDNSSTWWNPMQSVAWLISPLARQVGIALGAGSNYNITAKKPIK